MCYSLFQRINITQFKNCDLDPNENLEHFASFDNVSYECDADGYCDTIHATFNVPTILTTDKLVKNRITFLVITYSYLNTTLEFQDEYHNVEMSSKYCGTMQRKC